MEERRRGEETRGLSDKRRSGYMFLWNIVKKMNKFQVGHLQANVAQILPSDLIGM